MRAVEFDSLQTCGGLSPYVRAAASIPSTNIHHPMRIAYNRFSFSPNLRSLRCLVTYWRRMKIHRTDRLAVSI